MCAKSDYLLVTLHTEGEGINLNDYYGKEEENIKDDCDDDDKNKDDNDEKWAVDLPLLLELVVLAMLPLQDAPQQGL